MSTIYFPSTEHYPNTRQWHLATIWTLAEPLPACEMEVALLWDQRYAEAWCWQHEDEVLNNKFFLSHMQRVMDADLSYPIILSEEDYIFDGVHRLMKAKFLNMKTISCVKFKKDPESTYVK